MQPGQQLLPEQLPPQLAVMSQTIRTQQGLTQSLERDNQKLIKQNQKLELDGQDLRKDNKKLQEDNEQLKKDNQRLQEDMQRMAVDKRKLQNILDNVRMPQVFSLNVDDGYIDKDWQEAVVQKLRAAQEFASSQQRVAHVLVMHGTDDHGRDTAIQVLCSANQKFCSVAVASPDTHEGNACSTGILAVIFPTCTP